MGDTLRSICHVMNVSLCYHLHFSHFSFFRFVTPINRSLLQVPAVN